MNTRALNHAFAAAIAAPLALAALPAAAQNGPPANAMAPGNSMGGAMAPAMAPANAMGGMAAPMHGNSHLVSITIENLTSGQNFSPAFFATQAAGAAPLFKLGEPATEALWNVAEGGNIGPFSSGAAGMIGKEYGDAALAIHTLIGQHQTFTIEVDEAHPLVSGVFMLGMTNDGFGGVEQTNAWTLTGPTSVDVWAYDAGSEKNNELKGYLGALGAGNQRDPENGVVTRHTGIRGDADAPATWKFDPAQPVARVTFTPLSVGM